MLLNFSTYSCLLQKNNYNCFCTIDSCITWQFTDALTVTWNWWQNTKHYIFIQQFGKYFIWYIYFTMHNIIKCIEILGNQLRHYLIDRWCYLSHNMIKDNTIFSTVCKQWAVTMIEMHIVSRHILMMLVIKRKLLSNAIISSRNILHFLQHQILSYEQLFYTNSNPIYLPMNNHTKLCQT